MLCYNEIMIFLWWLSNIDHIHLKYNDHLRNENNTWGVRYLSVSLPWRQCHVVILTNRLSCNYKSVAENILIGLVRLWSETWQIFNLPTTPTQRVITSFVTLLDLFILWNDKNMARYKFWRHLCKIPWALIFLKLIGRQKFFIH